MNLKVNGRKESVDDPMSLIELLKKKGVKQLSVVAVELNGEILNFRDFDNIYLKDNDQVEILSFIGGG